MRNPNDVTGIVIGAAIQVHRELGPGLLESMYEECLCDELSRRHVRHERQLIVPVRYRGKELAGRLRLDLLVEDAVVVELKTVDRLLPLHLMQILSYLRLTRRRVGLLINFHVPVLKDGVRRVVNDYRG